MIKVYPIQVETKEVPTVETRAEMEAIFGRGSHLVLAAFPPPKPDRWDPRPTLSMCINSIWKALLQTVTLQ